MEKQIRINTSHVRGNDNTGITKVTPVHRVEASDLKHNIDGDQVYDTRTGKTVEDVEFSEILRKEMESK